MSVIIVWTIMMIVGIKKILNEIYQNSPIQVNYGEKEKNNLSLKEIKVAQTYILLNCEEIEPFVR